MEEQVHSGDQKGGSRMDGQFLLTAISSVGFPIVACMGLGYYTYKTTKDNREDINRMHEKYEEIQKQYSSDIARVSEALDNNTEVIRELLYKNTLDK